MRGKTKKKYFIGYFENTIFFNEREWARNTRPFIHCFYCHHQHMRIFLELKMILKPSEWRVESLKYSREIFHLDEICNLYESIILWHFFIRWDKSLYSDGIIFDERFHSAKCRPKKCNNNESSIPRFLNEKIKKIW